MSGNEKLIQSPNHASAMKFRNGLRKLQNQMGFQHQENFLYTQSIQLRYAYLKAAVG